MKVNSLIEMIFISNACGEQDSLNSRGIHEKNINSNTRGILISAASPLQFEIDNV